MWKDKRRMKDFMKKRECGSGVGETTTYVMGFGGTPSEKIII